MKRRFLAGLLAVVFTAGILTGCGNNKQEKDSQENENQENVQADSGTENKGNEPVKIRWATWDGGDTLKDHQSIVEEFNASQDDIQVEMLSITEDYDTKIATMIASGDVPEFAMLQPATNFFTIAQEGYVADLGALMDADPDFSQSDLLDAAKVYYDGKLVGSHFSFVNEIMYYCPDLFTKYGVEEPPAAWEDAWDWDTFVETARKLTIDANGNNALSEDFDPGSIETYGVYMNMSYYTWYPFLLSKGIGYLNEDGTATVLDTQEAAEVFNNIADLINKYHVMPSPAQSGVLPGVSDALLSGKVAMVLDGSWTNFTLITNDVQYNVAAFPKMGDNAKNFLAYGAISVMETEHKEEAWEFYKYLLTHAATINENGEGECIGLIRDGLVLPGNTDTLTKEFAESTLSEKRPANYYETCMKCLTDGTSEPFPATQIVNFPQIEDTLIAALDSVWSGDKTFEEAIAPVIETINSYTNGYYY